MEKWPIKNMCYGFKKTGWFDFHLSLHLKQITFVNPIFLIYEKRIIITTSECCFERSSVINVIYLNIPNSTWQPGVQKKKNACFPTLISVGYLVMLNKCLLSELHRNNQQIETPSHPNCPS